MADEHKLGGLLDELRAGGAVDSRGRFTLDRAQARLKMQKFQLVDARRYVLELVQAAALRGATNIAFDIDADDMRMLFDGQSFTSEEFAELWGAIFADGDERLLRGLRQLALGLNAALGLAPRRITVRSGGQQVVLRPGADEVMTAIEPPVPGTTIHVELRVRLGLVVEFFKNISGRLGEEVHLRERCVHTPLAVSLDGKAIAGGLRVAGAIAEHEFSQHGVRGVVALVPGQAPATLRLIKDGVWIDTLPLEQCGPGIVAVVEGEQLRRDVSLAKIVADDALAVAIGLARTQRWGLMARLVEAAQRGALPAETTMARVRAEALQFLRARDLRKRPELAVMAEALAWPDARTGVQSPRQVTLAEIAAEVEARRAAGRAAPGQASGQDEDEEKARETEVKPRLEYAFNEYPELAPEGPGIVRVDIEVATSLARIFGCSREVVDEALKRASARAQGRRAWLRRTTSARLPGDQRYLLRAPVTAEGLRGEVAIHVGAGEETPRAEGTVWLVREGCLLTRMDLAWGIAALDVILEGAFEPGELFDDVVRDGTLVRAVLHMLAALLVPLAGLVEETRDGVLAPAVRGLVKSWLLLVLDAGARDALWETLQVGPLQRPDVAAVQAVLPSPAQLRAGGGAIDVLLQMPLFEDFDRTWRSLDELARRQTGSGLAGLEGSRAPDPSLGREIARFDRSERKILAALLGNEATWSLWVPSMAGRRRGRKFWSQPAETMDAVATRMQTELRAAGIDPSLWSRRVQREAIDAVIVMAHGSVPPGVEPRSAQIELRFEQRALATRSVDLGIWPVIAVVEAKGIAPTPEWTDVEDEQAVTAAVAAVRVEAWRLVAGLLAAHREDLTRWRWVAAPLLLRLAEEDGDRFAAQMVPGLTGLPLLHTLAGGAVSIDEVEALLRTHQRIECVPPTTTTVDLGAPLVLRETEPVLAALRRRFGEASVVDGAERLRRRGREEKLAGLPKVERVAIDPSRVWATSALPTDGMKGVSGEIGLASGRTGGGLLLVLCVRGKRVGEFVHEDFPAPLEAILADDELPLDAQGAVDQRSKRYGQHIRRCRRAVAELIAKLCADYPKLAGEAKASARALLLAYAGERMEQAAKGSITTDRGLDAVRVVPLILDVGGEAHSLADIEGMGRVDAVGPSAVAPESGLELPRPVLRVDAAAERCLAGMKVRRIDERWQRELEALRELAKVPRYVLPEVATIAWVERKAMIAGGLQAHLWISREVGPQTLVFTRAGREVGRILLLNALPCSGVVEGDGLVIGEAVELEARQRGSLAKQICMLYEMLAKQLRAGRFSAEERERVLARLVEVDAALTEARESLLGSIGKPLEQLQVALVGIVSPAMRKVRAPVVPAVVKVPVKKIVERPVAVEKPAVVARAVVVEKPVVEAGATAMVPRQVLLAAVREELAWARERHGSLLETLGLAQLMIGEVPGGGIAAFSGGIVLQRRHPLVDRMLTGLLAGEAIDPIDLSFVVSAVYTLMNEVAEEIDAEDERAFVGRMAESLALGLR